MTNTFLLHDLVISSAARAGESQALRHRGRSLSYPSLAEACGAFAGALMALGMKRGERVAIYMEKRFEAVIAAFGASRAGCVFVPVNPLLKPGQVSYIIRDCGVRTLVTSSARLATMSADLDDCRGLDHILLVDGRAASESFGPPRRIAIHDWDASLQYGSPAGHRVIDSDLAAVLYTSGSTGQPKGVMLSHGNMVSGAKSVAQYLENRSSDILLAALPLSFDAGFSQLTTAFHAGASAVLLDYLLPQDVTRSIARETITGLTAVPPLWIQLARAPWPAGCGDTLRYFANTGGKMPAAVLQTLRQRMPRAKPFLMYGLTEAFRATYLPPEEVDRRPDSIGKAIPNAEVLVLRRDGTECAAGEPGELVQRGALVAQGYWNDPLRTAERFRTLPAPIADRTPGRATGEIAVFSGDTVQRDEEGFLYFIGRGDEMIKTSGYRVSPTELEEIVYATGLVGECAALGIADDTLGQSIVLIATAAAPEGLDTDALLAQCRSRMPPFMVPARIVEHSAPLPRNPNGKIDRKSLAENLK